MHTWMSGRGGEPARTGALPTRERLRRRHLTPPAIVLRPPPHVPDDPVGEGPRVLGEDRLDAETAHTPQQKNLRLPRRLPAASGALQRLVRFKEESDLPWAEIARRLGTYPHTVKRWWKEGVRPHFRHQMALLDLADDLGLGHLFTDWSVRRETGNGTPGSAGGERSSAKVLRPAAPPRCKSSKRKAARRRGGRNRRG